MSNPIDEIDNLITETLKSIHSHALQDGLANSYKTLDTSERVKRKSKINSEKNRYRHHSLFAVAASIALIIGIGLPILNSNQNNPFSDGTKKVKTADRMPTTTSKISESVDDNTTTTSAPLVVNGEVVTTTTTKNSLTQNTSPFYNPTTTSTTTPAVVNQLARISYSNTRANDIPLDGATISGNVYIFVKDPTINSVHWWLDQPGVWDKTLATRAGSKSPQDFNYRVQPEAIIPNPYDTSQLSIGEHTMGIMTRNTSGEYAKVSIKFYVTR